MSHVVIGLFGDSEAAGHAVAELKNKGYTKDISVVAKNSETGETDTHSVKEDGTGGAKTGAGMGAALGGAGALVAGITAVAIPGVGVVAGTIAAALAAAATGAAAGGVVGWMVDKGFRIIKPKSMKKEFNTEKF